MKPVAPTLAALSLLCAALNANATNVEGFPDPFFGNGSYRLFDFPTQPFRNDLLYAVAITADQRIVTAGTVNVGDGTVVPNPNSIGVSRLLADGAMDPSFGVGAGNLVVPGTLYSPTGTFQGYAMALQSDGKIVVAGTYYGGTSISNDFLIVRIRADGSGVDSTFGTNGIVVVPFDIGGEKIDVANAVAIQPDGKIIAAGAARFSTTDSDIAVVRLMPNGSLDPTFDGDGKKTIFFDLGGAGNYNFDVANAVALQPDGKILLAGSATTPDSSQDSVVVRLTASGALDPTFGNLSAGKSRIAFSNVFGAGLDDQANAIAFSQLTLDSNGASKRIVIGGSAGSDFSIAVLTDSGQLDTAFSGDGKLTIPIHAGPGPTFGASANALAIQHKFTKVGSFFVENRRIVVGGNTYSTQGVAHLEFALARVGFDGPLAGTCGTAGKSNFSWDVDVDGQLNSVGVQAMAQQGNQLIVGGSTQVRRWDGSYDTDFMLSRVVLQQ